MIDKSKSVSSESAASKLGLRQVDGKTEFDHKSLLASMGGWQGIIESIVPGFLFVLVFSVTKQASLGIIWASTVSVAFILIRLLRRKPLAQALSGLVGIALAAWLALRDGGSSRDYFLTGFITNLAYLVPLGISVLIRWPLVGVLMGLVLREGTSWRKNKYEVRVFTAATMLWVGLFAGRLLVQYPLYLANNLTALGIARLAMGLPLYAAVLWLNWLLVRGVIKRRG
ncbi:MAG: hypothetical protein RLZZ471_32 [Actinomycetota bacterium]